MENLTAGEYLSLLRAGFSLKDIKNISEVTPPKEVQPDEQFQPASSDIEPKVEEVLPPVQDKEEPQATEEKIDYKALYEESQDKLKKIQVANTQQNMQGTEQDSQEILNDLVRSFM